MVALKRGEALLALGRREEALKVLDALRDHYDREIRAGLFSREQWEPDDAGIFDRRAAVFETLARDAGSRPDGPPLASDLL